jgi:beta-galactosidase
LGHVFVYHRALLRVRLPGESVSADADLSDYKLVIAPTAYIADEQLAHSLQQFAEAGGTVLLGVRSGFKTRANQVTARPVPGVLRDLAGITIQDWHSLPPCIGYALRADIPALAGPAMVWAEALEPASASLSSGDAGLQILAQYTDGPFSGAAALTAQRVGAGQALYLGWYPNDRQAEALLAYLASQAGLSPIAALTEGLVASRHGPYVILLNFTDEPLPAPVLGQAVTVGPREVTIVRTRGG